MRLVCFAVCLGCQVLMSSPLRSADVIVTGHVIAHFDRRPIDGADVCFGGPTGACSYRARTNQDGAFSIEQLAPGRYDVRAVRLGFVSVPLGARTPAGLASSLVVGPGDSAIDLNLLLYRGAVISGTVTDPFAHPAYRVPILLERLVLGERQQAGSLQETDETGQYRFAALEPGDYLVTAVPVGPTFIGRIQRRTEQEVDSLLAKLRSGRLDAAAQEDRPPEVFVPVSYPRVTDPLQAAPISVGEGEHVVADLVLQLAPAVSIRGRVTDARGMSVGSAQIQLTVAGAAAAGGIRTTRTAPDGTFVVHDVAPATYDLIARAAPVVTEQAGGDRSTDQVARLEAQIPEAGLDGLSIVLHPSTEIAGKLIFEGIPRSAMAGLRIVAEVRSGSGLGYRRPLEQRPVPVGADGGFHIFGLAAGRFRLVITYPPVVPRGAYWLRSLLVDGEDSTDLSFVVREASATPVRVTAVLTSNLNAIVGELIGTSAPSDFVVAAIPHGSGATEFAKPDTAGGFSFQPIRSGEYDVAVLRDSEVPMSFDAVALRPSIIASTTVRVTDGGRTTCKIVIH